MKRDMLPMRIGERVARDLYPALSSEERNHLTEEEFAKVIARLLIETGDITETQTSTKQGEEHGIHNRAMGGWICDDDGNPTMHVLMEIAVPDREGSDYILKLVKKKRPTLDESVVARMRKDKEEAIKRETEEFFRKLREESTDD